MSGAQTDPNVLLIVVDSVRAHNCSMYGYRRRTTPFLESVAADSTVYTQARAPSNWSLPAHVSLFTGLEAHAHQVTVHDRLLPGYTVFEYLETSGYDTGLFTENGFIASHEVGLKDAFQTVKTVPEAYPEKYDTTRLNPGPDGFYYADAFNSWMSERNGPWAACVNLMDAHRPFEPRSAFDLWGEQDARTLQRDLPTRWEWAFHSGEKPYWKLNGLERLYDGGIRQADSIIKRIFDNLLTESQLDETLVVICGDHGDGFGQPGQIPKEPPAVSHIIPMHETLLHVPLLVRPPGGGDGHRCHQPATLTAFPNVVESALDGKPIKDGFARECAFATKQPVTADLRNRFEDACADSSPFFASSRAVYRPDPDDDAAVRKRYYWGDTAVECRIHAAGAISRTEPISLEKVEEAFTDDSPQVREPLAGRQLTDSDKEQLAALGYY